MTRMSEPGSPASMRRRMRRMRSISGIDEMVRDHDRQRDARHDHHGGRRRQAADHDEDGERVRARFQRQREHGHVPVDGAFGKGQASCDRQRNDENVDRDEIERKEPRGRAHVALIAVLDHGDVELARQQQDAAGRQECGRDPCGRVRHARKHAADGGIGRGARGEIAQAVEHPPRHVDADGDEGDELDEGFHRDREDEAVLVFGGVDVARAERHREARQHQATMKDRLPALEESAMVRPAFERVEHGRDRHRDRLQLQRDVGHRADDADDRDEARHLLGLAVAGRDEVGHGRDVLRLGDAHDAQHERKQQADDEDRPDVDRQEIQPVRRGETDRAEEGPRRAIDRQRQRVDHRPGAGLHEPAPGRVAVMGDGEQPAQVDQGAQDRDAAKAHAKLMPRKSSNDTAFFSTLRSPSCKGRPGEALTGPRTCGAARDA